MHNEVMYFIHKFKELNESAIEDVFLHGNCYWFAQILIQRFPKQSELYYMEIDGHFITKICDRFYDISGEVTDLQEVPTRWSVLKSVEPLRSDRIYRNCALFID